MLYNEVQVGHYPYDEKSIKVPISGLVVVFDGPIGRHEQTLGRLGEHPAIEIGRRGANRVAIVLETDCKQDDQQVWSWMKTLPGVIDVHIAFVGFEEEEDPGDRCSLR
jgi:nitrate reductase NapAB chaperone NapD